MAIFSGIYVSAFRNKREGGRELASSRMKKGISEREREGKDTDLQGAIGVISEKIPVRGSSVPDEDDRDEEEEEVSDRQRGKKISFRRKTKEGVSCIAHFFNREYSIQLLAWNPCP